MNNVLFLSSDNINAKTGAAKFARLLISKPDMWEQEGYILTCLSNSGTFTDETHYRQSFKHKAKQFIKQLLGITSVGRRIRFFNYYMNTLGLVPVKKVKPFLNDQTVVILNDLFVAWNFFNRYGGNYRTLFIMHNSGELLSMLKDEMQDSKIAVFLKKCEEMILNSATILVFVSEIARQNFIKVHPNLEGKTKTVYIGMNSPNYKKKYNGALLKIVTVGSVCERKNQLLSIKAIEMLRHHDIKLTIVGGGPLLNECKKYVDEKKLSEHVKFTGATSEVNRFLSESNLFLMTSKDEGLPVAAQEAMAMGLPLILTDVGGCRELIHDNGILIHPNIDEVVSAIQYFVDNPDKIMEYGKASSALYVRKFSLEKMLKDYMDILDSLQDTSK